MKTFISVCSALIVAIASFKRALHTGDGRIFVIGVFIGTFFLLFSVYMCAERLIKHTDWHVALERWYVNNSEQIVYSVFIACGLFIEWLFCHAVPQGAVMYYVVVSLRIFFGFGLVVLAAALVRSLRNR